MVFSIEGTIRLARRGALLSHTQRPVRPDTDGHTPMSRSWHLSPRSLRFGPTIHAALQSNLHVHPSARQCPARVPEITTPIPGHAQSPPRQPVGGHAEASGAPAGTMRKVTSAAKTRSAVDCDSMNGRGWRVGWGQVSRRRREKIMRIGRLSCRSKTVGTEGAMRLEECRYESKMIQIQNTTHATPTSRPMISSPTPTVSPGVEPRYCSAS